MYDVKIVICPQCGKLFEVVIHGHNHAKYCSDTCRKAHRKEVDKIKWANRNKDKVTRPTCAVCGVTMLSTRSKYCSDTCRKKHKAMRTRELRKNWGCNVTPSVENCMHCKYKDCINNNPATEEERETLNNAIGIYTNKQETTV